MKKSFIRLALVLIIGALMISFAGCEILDQMIEGPDMGPTHHHEYVEEITKAPTCAEEGVKTFTCSCDDSYTEAIEKLSHTEEILAAVAPTCTDKGLTEGKKCSVCNEIIVAQEVVDAKGHTAGDKQYANIEEGCPCEAERIYVVLCAVCGNEIDAGVDEPVGHSYTDYLPVVDVSGTPVCEIIPMEAAKCDNCNCFDCIDLRVTGVAPGHTEVVDAAVDPDCTNTGLTEGKHCSVCDAVIVEQKTVAALGHDYEGVVTTAPTCTDKGVKTFTCKNDSTHTYTEEIDSLGHADLDPKDHVCDNGCDVAQGIHAEGEGSHICEYCGVAAGECRAAEGSHNCAVCGEKLSDCAAAEKSHNCAVCGEKLSDCVAGTAVIENSTAASCGEAGSYDEVVYCSVCGDELNRTKHTVDALPHSYQENITKAPTCEEAGSKTLTCSACGDAKTEAIPALGHSETSYEAKAPTCTTIGWDAYVKCSRCDYTTYNELAVIAHTYNAVVTEPDCLNGGYTTYTCTGCNKTYKGDETVALGHKESASVTLPDCLNGGYTTYTCTACGETRTGDETAALGHTEETVAGKAATCLEAGITDGKKCSVCNVTLEEQTEIPATGHDYESVVTTAPTCTVEGLMTYTCKNCPDTYTKAITTSGHSFGDDFVCDNCNLDTTANRLVNGGFENGLDGWTLVGNIGGISSDKNYWLNDPERAEGYEFGMDGEKMFSAYAPGAEERLVGTLTSSSFVVGGSGFVTFKVGAMRDENYVYVDVVDAQTKQILARYYNGLWAERTEGVKSGCTLIAYKADLSAFMGKEVFFRLSDNADSGYGLFFADSFVTYYDSEPEGFNAATAVNYEISGTIYDLFNGSFEMGNVQGWWNNGEIGLVTNANGYWGDNIPYEKVGDYLFTGVESFGADTMREGNKGTLTSSVFEIGGTGWISFKLGGGGNEHCYIQIIDAVTGEILAKYHQQAQRDAILIQYVADLSAYIGRTARIQVVDFASNGWGCVSFDHVVTYYPQGVALPEGIVANDIFNGNYNINNGSFENGLEGWTQNIWDAGAHNTLGWVESSEHDAGWYTKNDDRKDGNNIFTFCKPDGTNCENTKGELVSSTFTLKQDSFVSFRFGGAGTREVRVELVRADGVVIATFYNEAPGKINTEMYAYFYQYTGETTECFFRVVDDSVSNYGCFVVDDFRANLESAPEGFIPAIQ